MSKNIMGISECEVYGQVVGNVVSVTPELALQWLGMNGGNRPLRKNHVEFLSKQMKNSAWVRTHQAIAFSNNRLIDGQHRLAAVVASGCTVPMLVITGEDDSNFAGAIDRGRIRSFKDDFASEYGGKTVETASYLAKVHHAGRGSIPPDLVERISSVIRPNVERLLTANPKRAKLRSGANVRAAAVLRMHLHPEHSEYIESQWSAWIDLTIDGMSQSIGTLYKRADANGSFFHGRKDMDMFVSAWAAFNPSARSMTIFNKKSLYYSETRNAIFKVMAKQ